MWSRSVCRIYNQYYKHYGQTLYIGVGDADNPRNTYVKTGSHGGTPSLN